MSYDVAIIGAGPAGLMAAKRAAEKGLKTVVIEKRKDVGMIKRCCCMNFILDEGYMGENAEYKDNKMIFPKTGFEVGYRGEVKPVYTKIYRSPSGYELVFKNRDTGKPISYRFDKGLLLKDLWNECADKGVKMVGETAAYNAEDLGSSVEINVVSKGKHDKISAKKAIIADGVNSRISAAVGLNEGRTYFATGLAMIFEIEGAENHPEATWIGHFGRCYYSNAAVLMGITLEEGIVELVALGGKNNMPTDICNNFMTKGRLKDNFKKAKVVRATGCAAKAFTGMKKPYKGNFIAIGDSAAYVEVETQGALMCGYKAVEALVDEFEGKKGFEKYTKWWLDSFEFNGEDFLQVAQGYALIPTYTDEELDYLFSIGAKKEFPGTYSQYKTPKLMWEAFLEDPEKIKREKPELYAKIEKRTSITLKGTF
ncbi:MAG: NAD(P)/FAD-dependent oxidoreductase [Candidatus Schekmanbacteria bacterium]|nr:MAG: NAD(P)/FAD-dependent oxidoreductase [Candidatus Schekmanbacteria bacterium]